MTPPTGEPIRPDHTCPRCGSHRVRGGKIGGPPAALYDYWCAECDLLEERRADAPDFDAWQQRWRSQSNASGNGG